MPEVQPTSGENLEQTLTYGMGSRREGILIESKEVFVLNESTRLIGVFTERTVAEAYTKLMPTVVEFVNSPDGYGTQEQPAKYTIRRVVLDRVETDA